MRGRAGEVFLAFLRLGLTSFGGPIAHLGYFRTEFVTRRGWLRDDEYADLVALCQVIPGPASSQVGFALGLRRAGVAGAFAAFLAFTLPSAVLMVAAALGARLIGGPVGTGAIEGLKIVAVAVVAHAVWGMAKTLTPDRARAGIAVVAALIALLLAGWGGPVAAIAFGVIAGVVLCRDAASAPAVAPSASGVPRLAGWVCLGVAATLLVGLPILTAITGWQPMALFDAFFRAGALVFGGGHVVLPLLEVAVVHPGWVGQGEFLAGYGIAQALPGPLFTFAAYLGFLADVGPGGIAGAAIALVAIFLPGFLLLTAALPLWDAFRQRTWSAPMLRGANAAVVGILAAALYTPVFTSAVVSPASFGLAVVCFVLLTAFRAPPWTVVLVGAAGGIALAIFPG
jgi:chromate transporter